MLKVDIFSLIYVSTYCPRHDGCSEDPGGVVACLAEVVRPQKSSVPEKNPAACHLLLHLEHLIGQTVRQTFAHLFPHSLQGVKLQALIPEVGMAFLRALVRHSEVSSTQADAYGQKHLKQKPSNCNFDM